MAVLKDLIVHGPSRFINVAQFNELKAETGTFNFLKAEDLTANKATVVGLLDVKGELHTNKWTSTNIANIGGSFYISPTYKSSTAKVTFGGSANSRTITVSNGSFGSTSANGLAISAWVANSKVMVTGSVTYSGTTYPLGTCVGTLNAAMSSSGFVVMGVSSDAIETLYSIIGTTQTDGVDIQISMYAIAGTKPVGILLTSYGTSQATYMDIYGGVNSNTGTPTVPNATPNLRVGYLGGLSSFTVNSITTATPTGWGVYTDNGFFKGTIASTSGVIGNWVIDSASIHSSGRTAWNTNSNGIWIAADVIAGGKNYSDTTPTWYIKADGSAKFGGMSLSSAGVLTVPAANVNGALTAATISADRLTAGTINSSVLTANNIVTDTLEGGTFNTDNYIRLSTQNSIAIKIGNSASNKVDWRIIAGKSFGVDKAGNLYATNADITGTVTASSLLLTNNATVDSRINNESIEVGGRNLFREDPLIKYILTTDTAINTEKTYYIRSGTGTDEDPYVYEAVNEPVLADISRYYEVYNSVVNYDAFDIELTEMPKEGETYTVQLWDVYVEHSGKTADNLGVWLYWGGGSIQLCSWSGTTYFTDGYAEHLEATLTITNAQATHANAANQWFRLYNSVPSATGTKYMSVGNWKFEKGNKATDWTLAPEDIDANLDNSVSNLNDKIEVATEILASKEALSEVDEIVRKYLGGTGYLYSNGAYLELGQSREKEAYKLALTPEALEFKAGDESVASLSNEELTITRTNVAETMRMGNFIWTLIGDTTSTRRLILKYSPL